MSRMAKDAFNPYNILTEPIVVEIACAQSNPELQNKKKRAHTRRCPLMGLLVVAWENSTKLFVPQEIICSIIAKIHFEQQHFYRRLTSSQIVDYFISVCDVSFSTTNNLWDERDQRANERVIQIKKNKLRVVLDHIIEQCPLCNPKLNPRQPREPPKPVAYQARESNHPPATHNFINPMPSRQKGRPRKYSNNLQNGNASYQTEVNSNANSNNNIIINKIPSSAVFYAPSQNRPIISSQGEHQPNLFKMQINEAMAYRDTISEVSRNGTGNSNSHAAVSTRPKAYAKPNNKRVKFQQPQFQPQTIPSYSNTLTENANYNPVQPCPPTNPSYVPQWTSYTNAPPFGSSFQAAHSKPSFSHLKYSPTTAPKENRTYSQTIPNRHMIFQSSTPSSQHQELFHYLHGNYNRNYVSDNWASSQPSSSVLAAQLAAPSPSFQNRSYAETDAPTTFVQPSPARVPVTSTMTYSSYVRSQAETQPNFHVNRHMSSSTPSAYSQMSVNKPTSSLCSRVRRYEDAFEQISDEENYVSGIAVA